MPYKHSSATAAEKILALYSLLLFSPQQRFSLSQLAEHLQCSKQTVLRLVDQLEAAPCGKVCRIRQGRQVLFFLERPAQLPRLSLSADGLHQLALCRHLLLHLLPDDVRNLSAATLHQAIAYSDAPLPSDSALVHRAHTKGRIDYRPFSAQWDTLLQAIYSRKVCQITYRARPHLPPTVFDYAPLGMVAYRESLQIMGWKVTEKGPVQALYDDPAVLLLHRCVQVGRTPRSSAQLPDIETDNNAAFGVMAGELFGVSVRFVPEAAAYVAERQWSENQHVVIHEDGSALLDFEAQSEAEVLSWLLSFGEKATVLEPLWLREELGRQAASIATMYAENAHH